MTTQITNITVASRLDYRKKLASFIRGVTDVPKEVLPYMPSILKLQSPMMTVTSAPTDRVRDTSKSYTNVFGFGLRLITLYARKSDTAWTTEMAEDMLDTLEQHASIALLLADMQSRDRGWRSVSRQGASSFAMLNGEGVQWLTETIPVIMEIDDGQE